MTTTVVTFPGSILLSPQLWFRSSYVIGILIGIWLIIRRRRRWLSGDRAQSDEVCPEGKDATETAEGDLGGFTSKPELDARPGFAAPVEMDAGAAGSELRGNVVE
jgi:hypothetical protein